MNEQEHEHGKKDHAEYLTKVQQAIIALEWRVD